MPVPDDADRARRLGAYGIVAFSVGAPVALVVAIWPRTRTPVVIAIAALVALRLAVATGRRIANCWAGARGGRPPRSAEWYRAHPAFGLRRVGATVREKPLDDAVLGTTWAAARDAERRRAESAFFGEVLWWAAADGARFRRQGEPARGILTAAAVADLLTAEPRELRVLRDRRLVIVADHGWSSVHVALRPRDRASLQRRTASATLVPPDDEIEGGLVVGAAILADGRLLCVQRAEPPYLAGLWEFPGGKVEPGEDAVDALVRECREELALDLDVGEQVGPDVRSGTGAFTLRVYAATIAGGELTLTEHSDARWLTASDLNSVEWIPADAPIVAAVAPLLRR